MGTAGITTAAKAPEEATTLEAAVRVQGTAGRAPTIIRLILEGRNMIPMTNQHGLWTAQAMF